MIRKCEPCYEYNGDCLSICPVNTSPNDDLNICSNIKYELVEYKLLNWICCIIVIFILMVTGTLFTAKIKIIKNNN